MGLSVLDYLQIICLSVDFSTYTFHFPFQNGISNPLRPFRPSYIQKQKDSVTPFRWDAEDLEVGRPSSQVRDLPLDSVVEVLHLETNLDFPMGYQVGLPRLETFIG